MLACLSVCLAGLIILLTCALFPLLSIRGVNMNLAFAWIALMVCHLGVHQCSATIQLVDTPSHRQQIVKSKFKFHCAIEQGSGPFTFVWTKNDQTLVPEQSSSSSAWTSAGGRIRVEQHSDDESVLVIDQLVSTDSANYSCLATNRVDTDVRSTLLVVKGWPMLCVCLLQCGPRKLAFCPVSYIHLS